MELDGVDGEGVEDGGFVEDILSRFARESDDEVSAAMDVALGSGADSPLSGGKSVPPVDTQKCGVVAAFDAVFQGDVMSFGQGGDVVEFLLVDTIRSGGDDEALDQGMGECFLVALSEHIERCKCVGIGLEISEIASGLLVAGVVESDTLVELLGDGFEGLAI